MHFKSPTLLFAKRWFFFQANNKENFTAPHYWPFERRTHRCDNKFVTMTPPSPRLVTHDHVGGLNKRGLMFRWKQKRDTQAALWILTLVFLASGYKYVLHTNVVNHLTLKTTNRHHISFAVTLGAESLWRHQMEAFSAFLPICAENHRSPVDSLHNGTVTWTLSVPWLSVGSNC